MGTNTGELRMLAAFVVAMAGAASAQLGLPSAAPTKQNLCQALCAAAPFALAGQCMTQCESRIAGTDAECLQYVDCGSCVANSKCTWSSNASSTLSHVTNSGSTSIPWTTAAATCSSGGLFGPRKYNVTLLDEHILGARLSAYV